MKGRRLFWAAVLGAAIPGCGDVAVEGGARCTSPAQCDDMNACTADTCELGFCMNKPVPDGDSAAQTPGDCKKLVCADGVEASMIDMTDAKSDSNDCTLDTCSADGKSEHTAVTQDTFCMVGGQPGHCNAFGVCYASDCVGLPACDDLNPCTVDTCSPGEKCDFVPLDGILTPGDPQMTGDCRLRVCVMGVDTSGIDDNDLPISANDCVIPTCSGGTPSQPPAMLGTPCKTNNGKVCDGNGTCVVCNVDADCISPQTCTGNPKTCQ